MTELLFRGSDDRVLRILADAGRSTVSMAVVHEQNDLASLTRNPSP